tara:strand:- start:242 stop:616 length:375 start_codon:yes stop_codon:yes gene_type:complete
MANSPSWEGNFRLIETKEGSSVFTIKASPTGKYDGDTVADALAAVIKAKVRFDGWKLWVDGDFATTVDKGEIVTPSKLAKLVKEADVITLAFVKRPFPQPKIRLIKGDGATRSFTRKASNLREL